MGSSVWEFMWCLDKITSIEKIEEKGLVLYGNEINLKDIANDLGIIEHNISKNLNKLSKFGYIEIFRTGRGIIIKVNKAKKRFNNKSKSPLPNTVNQETVIGKSEALPTYILQDSNNKTITTGLRPPEEIFIPLFELVNPNFKAFYANRTERKALIWLLEKYGADDLRVKIMFLPKLNAMPFAPTVTSPYELKNKLGKISSFLGKEKNKVELNKQKIFK